MDPLDRGYRDGIMERKLWNRTFLHYRQTRLVHMITSSQYRLKLAKIIYEVLHSCNRAYRKHFSDADLQVS